MDDFSERPKQSAADVDYARRLVAGCRSLRVATQAELKASREAVRECRAQAEAILASSRACLNEATDRLRQVPPPIPSKTRTRLD